MPRCFAQPLPGQGRRKGEPLHLARRVPRGSPLSAAKLGVTGAACVHLLCLQMERYPLLHFPL